MKFGVADFGMNVWYGGLFDLASRLKDIKAIGLDGIERMEAISAEDAMQQAVVYHELGLDFAWVRGPKVRNTIQWTCAFGKDYIWLDVGGADRNVDFDVYCRRCNDLLKVLKQYHIDGLLHNHLGSRVESQEELDRFMEKCPDAKLIFDIGHLHGAGGDIVGTAEKYHDRIKAMHFKDVEIMDAAKGLDKWHERLRFRELGAGNCNEDYLGVARSLVKHNWDGWVFIEQDCHTDDPLKQIKISADILKKEFGR